MKAKNLAFNINYESEIPKYQQLVNIINNSISKNLLDRGKALPSVNSISIKSKLSRSTVFKAYSILKTQGVIDSVRNKGYFVLEDTRKVLLILDTFKSYKEVLYHSIVKNLPDNIIADVQFHHYKIENFKTIINNSVGKYYKYVVMNFDHKGVASVLDKISIEKLLLIDWNIHSNAKNNYVFQDFGKAFYESLIAAEDLFRKYESIEFVYPSFSNHPVETLTFFKKFCKEYGFNYKIIRNHKEFQIEKNKAYISVSDRILRAFLDQCREKDFEPGVDVGLLSYNDTPMKKFIYKGISVVTTDFRELGIKTAEFVTKDEPMQHYVSTKLILRESL